MHDHRLKARPCKQLHDSCQALEAPAEADVLAVALRWLEADPPARLPQLERLLSTARIPPAIARSKVPPHCLMSHCLTQ